MINIFKLKQQKKWKNTNSSMKIKNNKNTTKKRIKVFEEIYKDLKLLENYVNILLLLNIPSYDFQKEEDTIIITDSGSATLDDIIRRGNVPLEKF